MKKFILFFVFLLVGITGVSADYQTTISNPNGLDIGLGNYPIGYDSTDSALQYCIELGGNDVFGITTISNSGALIEAYEYIGAFDLYYTDLEIIELICNFESETVSGSGSFIVATLNEISTDTRDKVPTAFEGDFGNLVVDLLMLGLIIISIIVFKKVTNRSKQ